MDWRLRSRTEPASREAATAGAGAVPVETEVAIELVDASIYSVNPLSSRTW